MKIWHQFINNVKLRRIVVLLVLISILYFFRTMMTTILLTFIITLLVTKLVHWIQRRIKIPSAILVVIIYALVITGVALVLTIYLPKISEGIVSIYHSVIDFYNQANSPSSTFGDNFDLNSGMQEWLSKAIEKFNVIGILKSGLNSSLSYLTMVGSTSVSIFMALILSFFFTIEEKQMANFSKKFLESTFGWFFQDIYYFAKIFVQTFGVVLEAQVLIALCNTILTSIALAFMGLPHLFILTLMVFILSLIPVAGVIISFVPLSLVGFSVGGLRDVLYMIIMVLVIHMIEAYILNPKFMSSKTQLPIFYTFVVLLIGEELFGGWGLIVSVPIFTFFLDLLGVQSVAPKTIQKIVPSIQKLKKKVKR